MNLEATGRADGHCFMARVLLLYDPRGIFEISVVQLYYTSLLMIPYHIDKSVLLLCYHTSIHTDYHRVVEQVYR